MSQPSNEPNNLATNIVCEKEKYFSDLRIWLNQAKVFQELISSFPYYFLACQSQNIPTVNPLFFNNNYQRTDDLIYAPVFDNANRPNQPAGDIAERPRRERRNSNDILIEGYEYAIPPLWKRFLAEQLDFVFLLFLKLALTYIAVDYFDAIDMSKYDLDIISKRLQEDYVIALELTSDILMLELLYRVLVCLFEAVCLSTDLGGRPGGATPGKAILGLRVVSADSVVSVIDANHRNLVVVCPGTGLTFSTSLLRAATKNVFIAFMLPVFILTMFIQYNRSTYDLLCNVIVVEESINPPRRRV